MQHSFHDVFKRAWRKKGYRTLIAFYQAHSFSFSYEYLRQIYAEQKVPSPEKVRELAHALGVSEARLQKLADQARLEQRIRHYYRRPAATRTGRLAEKVKQYGGAAQTDAKIMRMVELLSEEEKDQLLTYLKFLKKEWQKKRK